MRMSKRKRPPAPSCAQCAEPLEAVGGKRLVGTPEQGVLVSTPETALGDLQCPARVMKLLGKEYLVTYGAGWTVEAETRALEAALDGMRPWICQRCAGRTCKKCGAPLEYPIASTLLNDDGAVMHLMIVPSRNSCINPSCSNAIARIQ